MEDGPRHAITEANRQAARDELLATEDERRRALDALATARQRLPIVEFDDHKASDRPQPDLATIAALCRMQLEARRLGCSIHVHNVSNDLRQLIDLAGLTELLLCQGDSGNLA
jgi:ABC-type transporter Mla MlaB component